MSEYMRGYDDLTVPEVKEAIADNDFGLDRLREIREYESANKDRVGVIDHLDEMIDEHEDRLEENADRLSGLSVPLSEAGQITVTPTMTGYIAGMHFESVHETRAVPPSVRIREALNEGKLERVRPRR